MLKDVDYWGGQTVSTHLSTASNHERPGIQSQAAAAAVTMETNWSWDLQWSQEKTKTTLMQNLGGQTKNVMVFSEVAYFAILKKNREI